VLLRPGSASGQEKKLEIGAVLSLTGAAAVHGSGIQEGVEFASRRLKDQGWGVEVNYQDDATLPRRTLSALEALLHCPC
jgi:ABC-type branched-subunit amino acid transport system substrate-binding protein